MGELNPTRRSSIPPVRPACRVHRSAWLARLSVHERFRRYVYRGQRHFRECAPGYRNNRKCRLLTLGFFDHDTDETAHDIAFDEIKRLCDWLCVLPGSLAAGFFCALLDGAA